MQRGWRKTSIKRNRIRHSFSEAGPRVSFPLFLGLFFLRLFPEGTVHFLVEGRTAGGELAQLVVLGAHQGRAVAEGAADALAIELAVLLQLQSKIGLRQCGPADTDEGDPAVADIGCSSVKDELLQVAVAAADHRQVGKALLNLARQAKMPVDANEWVFRGLVGVGRRILERANHMHGSIRIAHADVDQRHAELHHLANPPHRLG